MQGCAIFRAIGKGDVAVLTQWLNQSSYDQTEPTLLKPPKQDLYQIVLVDHIIDQKVSRLALEDRLFHFINVFRLTPSKKPRVTMGFAQGILRRIVPGPPRLRQYDLVAVSLSHAT